jgi:hypothetical protein
LRIVAALGWGSYAGLVAYGVKKADPAAHDASTGVLAAAFPVMHAAWGAGFVRAVVERFRGANK